jgi:quinol-cytochrome oxidoreductase complex cytochrome b subunit/mono/diheme cytochrome c family protein
MSKLLDWLDHRTGYREVVHEALYERIPGGARWRYVWGSTLVTVFVVQVITGVFLWMAYSPSAQTAWESVYYIQFHMTGGWLLRGIHHYAATAMVVLLALHLLQVVIDGAYRAPREINFWLGLILMMLVLGLALTGYLLPWDQKGYWATQVATKIAGLVPLVGQSLQSLIVGGSEYGHHTLTRFFALHAGVLPGLLILVLMAHLSLFRRHGLTAKQPYKRADTFFWPDQLLRDSVSSLAVLITVVVLAIFFRAELGAPADPGDSYDAARPEWYFLFLFQFLKFFHGETGELIGAIVAPGVLMLLLFLMPFIGRSRAGHVFNVALILAVLAGAAALTGLAVYEDHQARWMSGDGFAEVEKVLTAIEADIRKNGPKSPYFGKTPIEQGNLYFTSKREFAEFGRNLWKYQAYRKSLDHQQAIELAEENGQRAQLLSERGIPPTGALTLIHSDPRIQGPKLFRKHCAACHDHADADGNGIRTIRPLEYPRDEKGVPQTDKPPLANGAPNLYRFASREWLRGLLDAAQVAAATIDKESWQVKDAPYFGNTNHRGADSDDEEHLGMMALFVKNLAKLNADQKAQLERIITALSAEAELPSQEDLDAKAKQDGSIEAGRKAFLEFEWPDSQKCADCHTFRGAGTDSAPELTGYGSRQWLIDFISDPAHERFYEGKHNDRMPAFAKNKEKPQNNLLTAREIELLADWLRGDWYEPQ